MNCNSLQGYRDHHLSLFQSLFNCTSDNPFFIKNSDLLYVTANESMARLCGLEHESQIIGKSAGEFFGVAQAHRFETWDRQVMKSGRAMTLMVDRIEFSAANPVWLIFSRVPVPGPSGIVGVAATARQLSSEDPRANALQRLTRAMTLIRTKPDDSLDIKSLARRCDVSVAQLQRDFRCFLGVTPREFHLAARVERAVELLRGDHSIASIAYQAGFSDHSAFSRGFRRITGVSPSAFRRATLT